MKKLLAAAVLLFASVCALGQGSTVLFPPAVNSQGNFLPFAKITFCTAPATLDTLGNCTNTVTVFKDQALTQPYSSAILTDGIGYFPPNANTATSIWFTPAANLCFTLTTSNMLSPATNPCTPFPVANPAGGPATFSKITFNTLGLNPTTGIPLLKGGNTAITAQQPGFPVENPQWEQFLENNSNIYFANPQVYLSRVDQTPYVAPSVTPGVGSCFNGGPLASCDQPIMLIMGTNQNTGSIPGMVGVECNLWGFKANAAGPPVFADYEVCFGANLSDAAVPNITNLRGANWAVGAFGLPAQTGPGGFTRSVGGQEIDIFNSSGADGAPLIAGGTGNFLFGQSLIMTGVNSATEALSIASTGSSGKGWLDGIEMGGIVNCGLCIYTGGPGVFSPTTAIHISDSGTYGLIVGSGTLDENKSTSSNSAGNPTNGIILDAKGTVGVNETQDSNTLVFNAKTASTSASAFTVKQLGTNNNLDFAFGATAQMDLGSTGVMNFPTATGRVKVPGGSASLPSIALFDNTTGFTSPSSGIVDMTNNGVAMRFQTNSLNINSTTASFGLGGALSPDGNISRLAAASLAVGNGTTGNTTGKITAAAFVSGGAAAGLTGTGACATISTQTGGSMAGRATCTGTTGASTFTITPGTTAPNGWVCNVQDQTTRANLLQQTATVAASCTLTATSVTQNDVVVFTAIAF